MDRFEVDVIYDVADIHARLITHSGAFEHLKDQQDRLEEYETNHAAPERYFFEGGVLHVYQIRLKPPCYRILPRFKSIRKLYVDLDLDLPTDPTRYFYSKLIAGGDYVWAVGENYDRYQNYTVEVFGLGMPMHPLTERTKRIKVPDPRQYATPPKYWYESRLELIQIWRTRVFRSAPELFTASAANPLTPYRPSFPHLEERWHPNVSPITIGVAGIDKSSARSSLGGQFFADAYQILKRSSATSGRPRSYKTLEEFYCEVRKVYRQLTPKSNRPLQKEVALRMDLSLTSFNRYWSRVGLRWKDAHELFKSQLIPPQISNAPFDQ